MLMIGTILDGRYRVLKQLGAGAMGEVYLAEHLNLGRKEALNIQHPSVRALKCGFSRLALNRIWANRLVTGYSVNLEQ